MLAPTPPPPHCVPACTRAHRQLIDFGLTKHVESVQTLRVGTPEYMAPELLVQPPGQAGGYDARKVDAWALGVLLYVLVCAAYPYEVRVCVCV